MISRFWRRGIAALGICIGVLWLLWWSATEAIDGVFANDEQTALQTSLPMLDGRVQLGLYRQHMWDALLWTVMVAPDSLPRVVPAHNGVITSTLSVVMSQAQLGFQDPELQLRKVSRTDATLCDNRTCDTIRCAEATRSCERIVVK